MLPAFDSPEEFWAMMGCGMEILRGTATVVLACFLDDHSASSVCSCYPHKPPHLRGAGRNQPNWGKPRPSIPSPSCRERGTLPSSLPPNCPLPAPLRLLLFPQLVPSEDRHGRRPVLSLLWCRWPHHRSPVRLPLPPHRPPGAGPLGEAWPGSRILGNLALLLSAFPSSSPSWTPPSLMVKKLGGTTTTTKVRPLPEPPPKSLHRLDPTKTGLFPETSFISQKEHSFFFSFRLASVTSCWKRREYVWGVSRDPPLHLKRIALPKEWSHFRKKMTHTSSRQNLLSLYLSIPLFSLLFVNNRIFLSYKLLLIIICHAGKLLCKKL